jgi:hypothetical protein
MNIEWVQKKEEEVQLKIDEHRNRIVNVILNCDKIKTSKKERLVKIVMQFENDPDLTSSKVSSLIYDYVEDGVNTRWVNKFVQEDLRIEEFLITRRNKGSYFMFLDSDSVEFDGDIIITDPYYIVEAIDESAKQGNENSLDDWDVCECGYNMAALGLTHFMSRNTLFEDVGFITYNYDTKEKIGYFSPEVGMIGVFNLSEVLVYNPMYSDHVNNSCDVTLIKDFKGSVRFIVEEDKKSYNGYVLRVVGNGVNKSTGKPLNFVASQAEW